MPILLIYYYSKLNFFLNALIKIKHLNSKYILISRQSHVRLAIFGAWVTQQLWSTGTRLETSLFSICNKKKRSLISCHDNS